MGQNTPPESQTAREIEVKDRSEAINAPYRNPPLVHAALTRESFPGPDTWSARKTADGIYDIFTGSAYSFFCGVLLATASYDRGSRITGPIEMYATA